MKKALMIVLAVAVGCVLATGAWSLEGPSMGTDDIQLMLAGNGKGFGGGEEGSNDGTGDNGGKGPGGETGTCRL